MTQIFDSIWNTYIKDSMPIAAAIVGAFGGGILSGFLVHWLTRSREQEAWLRNCEKEEWRELLSALTTTENFLARLSVATVKGNAQQKQEAIDAYEQACYSANRVLFDRLYINDDLEGDLLPARWRSVQSTIESALIAQTYTIELLREIMNEFEPIKSDLRKVALKRFTPKTAFQRLQFWKD